MKYDDTTILFFLTNVVNSDNNFSDFSIRNNFNQLNLMWDKLDDEQQEKYCVKFNRAKERLVTYLYQR